MTEPESQSSIPASGKLVDPHIITGTDASSQLASPPRGKHEPDSAVSGLATEPPADGTLVDLPDDHRNNGTTTDEPAVNVTVEGDTSTAAASGKPKTGERPVGKTDGGSSTLIVKRIISSGTFGTGSVKSVASKPAVTSSSAPKPVLASPLKKSTSSSAAQSKLMTSSRPTATGTATVNRRTSVVPTKPSAPPITKPSLSGTNVKVTSAASTNPRTSVTSSVGSTSPARPRASVSEGVKRAPLTSRQSLSTTSKPLGAPATKTPSTTTKPARTTSSISSIKEVKEDARVLENLQKQLREATEALASKAETVIELEERIRELQSALESALADAATKGSSHEQLEVAKTATETKLNEVTDAMEKLQTEHSENISTLSTVHQELEIAKTASHSQSELVQNLQAQIQFLQSEVVVAKDELEGLRNTHGSAISDATAAVTIEREALIKARADITAITAENETLKITHAQSAAEVVEKLRVSEIKAVRAGDLELQLSELEAEKAADSNKLSELEVEILELKESQEGMEDERGKLLARLTSLEESLAAAVAATEKAAEDTKATEAAFARQAEDSKKLHENELKAAADDYAKVVADLEALRTALADAQANHERAVADARAAAEEHDQKFNQAEKDYQSKEAELLGKIQRLMSEFEGQEAKYQDRVDAIKAEHDKLLRDAFDRAKNEAGDAHSQELQTLRAESNATIQQLQATNQLGIEALKAEHHTALEMQVKPLEKQLMNQGLELKAMKDDLTKAKAALESSRSEVTSLTAQRDEARAAAAAVPDPSPAQAEEVERLSKELSRLQDDLAAATDVLDLTKASLTDLSNNHVIELEEAAKGRAEEVINLRTGYDETITALVAEKSELLTKLSDLEGELATVKASIPDEPAPLKGGGTGNGAAHPPSPGVTKEELQLMHEAHNLKLHDIRAEHDKSIVALQKELDAVLIKNNELQQEVERKAMEIVYLEQEQEDNQDQITRLMADTEQHKGQDGGAA